MAKTHRRSTAAQAEVQDPQLQPLPPCGRSARLLPQVRPLPDLPARARPQGLCPRHDQVELVTSGSTMLTDPISDYLTRVRNAIARRPRRGRDPASRLKKEMTRILDEQGYISGFAVEPTAVGRGDPDPAQVHRGPRPVISGMRARSRARAGAATSPSGEVPRVQGGMGTAIISTSTGVMTGHEAKAEGRRRRGRRLRLVARMDSMSRIGRKPIDDPRRASPSTSSPGA